MNKKTYQQALDPGSTIERFEIVDVLGVGGFGITYKAIDNDLHHEVAVKEYLPSDCGWRLEGQTVVPKSSDVTEEYEYGLERFLDEGRTLAKFKHPNIVRVVRFLRANGTGYLVMDYEYGQTFHEYLIANPSPDEDTLLMIMISVLKGLSHIHSNGVLHRDIKPGNIYVRDEGEALLIDFGAARYSVGEHSQSMTGIVTAGYAPYEQYSVRAKQSPACDLYALGASLYRALSGAPPVEAPDRITSLQESEIDSLTPALDFGMGSYSERFLKAVDWMLQPLPKDRPQSAEDILQYLFPDEIEDDIPTVSVANSQKLETVSEELNTRNKINNNKTAPKKLLDNKPILVVGSITLAIVLTAILFSFFGGEQGIESRINSIPVSHDNTAVASKTGLVSIGTKPQGAKVYINEKYLGKTPFNHTMPTGTHKVRLEKSDFAPYKRTIIIKANNKVDLSLILKPITPFRILTTPRNASIKFLNKSYAYRDGMKLPLGHYDLSISAPGYKTRRMRFPVSQDGRSRNKGTPATFRVTLDNENLIKKYNLKKYGRITALRYVPKLKYLLVSTIYSELYLLDLNPKASEKSLTSATKKSSTRGEAVDLDSNEDNSLSYSLIRKYSSYHGKVYAISKDKKHLFIGTQSGQVILYDMLRRKELYTFKHPTSKIVRAITVSADQKKMAVVVGTELHVWNLRNKKQIINGELGNKVSQIMFSKDQRSLLVYRWYQPYFDRISLADNKFKAMQRFKGNDKGLYNMVMSSDRKMIFAEGNNYHIKAWNLKTAAIVRTYKGHSDSVNYIALRNGRLYSAGRDRTLRVWDVASTKQIAVLQGHRTILGAVDVAPDGTIFSGDDNGQVFLWKLK